MIKELESKPLTNEECLKLINCGDDDSRNELIRRSLPLVRSVANNFSGLWDMKDLIQVGMIGVHKAIDRYDISKSNGASFTSYAYYWIREEITKELRNNSTEVRIPYHLIILQRQIEEKTEELKEKKIAPTSERLSEELGKTVNSIELAQRINGLRRGSIYRFGEGSDMGEMELTQRKIESMIINEEKGVEESVLSREEDVRLKRDINNALNTLGEDHKKVLELRFGLNGKEMVGTLEEIAEIIGVSKERVRRIELLALKSIRNSKSGRRATLRKYIE